MKVIPIILLVLQCSSVTCLAGRHTFSIRDTRLYVNDQEFKIIGLRCSNALISDRTTRDLIDHLDTYQSYGVNTVSVYFMGSRFGNVKGYRPDASLDREYAERMARIIESADERGMVVLVGCLYWSTSRAREDLGHWTQAEANRAVANTVKWIADNDFRNVFVDPDNEGMAVRANGWRVESMISAGHAIDPSIMLANNTRQHAGNSDLNIHFGEVEGHKPWLDTESTPDNVSGGYWGDYSKVSHQADSSFYNYSRIGRYTCEMKMKQWEDTRNEMENFSGYVMASTWLQCGPDEGVNGPFCHPGGRSALGSATDDQAPWNKDVDAIHPDAGILWWLEFIRENYGPWNSPPIQKPEEYRQAGR